MDLLLQMLKEVNRKKKIIQKMATENFNNNNLILILIMYLLFLVTQYKALWIFQNFNEPLQM